MKPHLRIGLCILLFGLLLAAVALILRKDDLELSNDEAPFNSIVLPPKSVRGDMYMDGGSIHVNVIDADGKDFDFAFPYDYHSKAGTHYRKAFHGAALSMQPGAIQLHDPERAKEIVINLLYRYADPDDRFTMSLYDTLAENEVPIRSILAYGRELIK